MKTALVGKSPVAQDIFQLCSSCGLEITMYGDPPQDLAFADWIVDVSGPDIAAQRASLRAISDACGPKAIVTADASVATVSELITDLPPSFAQRFTVSHFFVPTSRVALVELVQHNRLAQHAESFIQGVLRHALSRIVVSCRDQPGFLGNRMGLYLTARACSEALKRDWPVHTVDTALSLELGLPRLGAFGLVDLVGGQVLLDIARDLRERLPPLDPWNQCDLTELTQIVQAPGFGGFFRRRQKDEPRQRYDIQSGSYLPCDADGAPAGLANFIGQLHIEISRYAETICGDYEIDQRGLPIVMAKGFGWSPEGLLKTFASDGRLDPGAACQN